MQNSISCIVPLYGLLKNNNLYRFSLLIDSICSAVSRIDASLFELILINDNPDEDIEELITDILSSKNANFLWYYYVNEKNIGQGATRNKGAAFSNIRLSSPRRRRGGGTPQDDTGQGRILGSALFGRTHGKPASDAEQAVRRIQGESHVFQVGEDL